MWRGGVETEEQQERGFDREQDQDEEEQGGDSLCSELNAENSNPLSPANIHELRSLLAILEGGGGG